MRKLAKIAAPALAAVAALGAIAPASAQDYSGRYDRGGWHDDGRGYGDRGDYDRYDRYSDRGQIQGFRAQIDNLQWMIQRRDERGLISSREAYGLRRDVQDLRQMLNRMSRDGLSRFEANMMQNRIRQLSNRMVRETRDRDGWRR